LLTYNFIMNRQITEKELKIAAKQCGLKTGLIEYVILKVRENQKKSHEHHSNQS